MYDWCHSGLEGYCKAAADVLVLADAKGKTDKQLKKDKSDAVTGLCRDILPDRSTSSNVSRAWTFSNARQGKNNRLMIFEKCWLDGKSVKEYRDEAKEYVDGTKDLEDLPTISGDPEYEQRLRQARNATERDGYVAEYCVGRAIAACVDSIIELSLREPELIQGTQETDKGLEGRKGAGQADDDRLMTQAASVTSLVCHPDFVSLFFERVMPAIGRGFLSERYRPSDVEQFDVTLTGLIEPAHRCLVFGEGDLEPYREFLTSLVAGLIYGPTYPIAINRPWDATLDYEPYDGEQEPLCSGIRLTQVFDDMGRLTGYSEVYHPSQVVFFGRCPDVSKYLEVAGEIFGDEPDVLEAVRSRETVVFPMTLQDAVGNCHAVLMRDPEDGRDAWYLYELGTTTNGTSIAFGGDAIEVDRLVEIRAGDRIRLGAPADAEGPSVFWVAATVAFSLNVDRNAELV